ncbi:hypothetical protein [Kibdelosporangium phytohabitans]|uniref:hypothetical protein n=1 Tax=Kibdelosporangium phytohabitans TaxID=860235 RepID=UPI0012F8C6A4|nr:hypothetical protein [Kibdelosporangium phytohabitans]MBE1462996.1 uncharacterized protein YjeT (DUF2065 family) [Kibdelosporangium phytohabitans]
MAGPELAAPLVAHTAAIQRAQSSPKLLRIMGSCVLVVGVPALLTYVAGGTPAGRACS